VARSRLGVNAVRSIVMGIAMQQFILAQSGGLQQDHHNLEHSVRSAGAARVIAAA
jgi:HD-like signal output (HDOD) protein